MWVDKETQELTCGEDRERVMSVRVEDSKIKVDYGEGWEEYIFSREHPDNKFWKEVLTSASEKLSKKMQPSKGSGKGRPAK